MTKTADLTDYLFDGQPHLLSVALSGWMEASTRYTSFVETYRDKIRKKIRVTSEPESILDLRAELEVAYCLLNDPRLSVAYEPYASAKGRGPDFAVTYRANLVFNIEVTRLRMDENSLPVPEHDPQEPVVAFTRKEERILHILLAKLGQMLPGMPNLLFIHTRPQLARSIDLGGLMQRLKTRVEGRNPSFFPIDRYSGPDGFYRDFLHLNAILLWASVAQFWVNKQARPVLPHNVQRLVASLPLDLLPLDSRLSE